MNIGFMKDHSVKPAFKAGGNYEAKIIAATDKDSGFTLELEFAELSVPGFWHFNVAHESETAKRISMDELHGLLEQTGEINETAALVGQTIQVRLLSQPDSALPRCALPVAKAKAGGSLSL